MRSARRFYRLSLALGTLGGVVVVLAILSALRALSVAAPSAERLLQACGEVVFSGQTVSSVGVLLFTGVGVAVIALATRSTVRHWRAQRAVISRLPVEYETVHRGISLRVFTDSRPEAFCAGLLQPRVYLSSAAVDAVEDGELAAVIEHESHHCARRDPLRILIVQVLSDSLFFLPAMRHLRGRYCMLAELAADEAAIAAGAERRALAAALITFAATPSPGVVGIAPERVDHLLGERARWELPTSLIAGTLVTLLGLLAGAMALMHTARPGALSIAVLAAQACMIVMVAAPLALGAGSVLLTHRRWKSAQSD